MSNINSCKNPREIQNRVPVTNWELDKYLLNEKERVVVEMVRRACTAFPEYPFDINGVVDKVIKMTPRFLLGIIQKEMTPGLQICILRA